MDQTKLHVETINLLAANLILREIDMRLCVRTKAMQGFSNNHDGGVMKVRLASLAIGVMMITMASSYAVVTADEAKQLGSSTLTSVGAEKAANKEGTIPEYTGAVLKASASYDPKNEPGHRPDPWDERPLFSITAQNADKYADKLDGMLELFKKYPHFRMDIYPSHRTTTFPKYVIENTLKNAASCKAVDGELRVDGCYGGYPFPFPKSGNQVMWNHLLAYQAHSWMGIQASWFVPNTGNPVLQSEAIVIEESPFYNPARNDANGKKDTFWRVRVDETAPTRKVGGRIVMLDPLDALAGRRAYQYVPGQRRVKLAPDLSYDTPNPWAGGGAAIDDGKGFLGPMDRYDFKLVGKKEKFIVYNAFKTVNDFKTCPDTKLLTKNFLNPDCLRWELHRVWVVEATLKPNVRHIYKRRVFYWDEDGYAAGTAENYDASNKLWRVVNVIPTPFFDVPGQTNECSVALDLQSGAYTIQGMGGRPGRFGWYLASPKGDIFFSPEALAAEGVR